MKVTIVYESMFGNTHEVAEAIGDGVRDAHPDADVECVPVGDAWPKQVDSADLLIIGGPTHIRGMTSGFSRKMGISGEEKAEAKASRPTISSRMPRDRACGNGSTGCRRLKTEARPLPSTPALGPQWRVARPTGLPAGCVSTATTW